MSGFAFCVSGTRITNLTPKQAVNASGELAWIHLTSSNEEAEAWLRGDAGLPDYIVESLIAAETRPRCDQIGEGAFLNLRGRSSDAMPMSGCCAMRAAQRRFPRQSPHHAFSPSSPTQPLSVAQTSVA